MPTEVPGLWDSVSRFTGGPNKQGWPSQGLPESGEHSQWCRDNCVWGQVGAGGSGGDHSVECMVSAHFAVPLTLM